MTAGIGSAGGDAADLFLPGVIPYSAVISACEKGSAMAAGIESLELMQQTRVLPGVFSCSSVFSACEKVQQGSKHWVFWRRCGRLVFCLASFLLSRYQCL